MRKIADHSSPKNANRLLDKLTLRGLRIFMTVEETRSIAAAAKMLDLSKSNVSQQITTLEDAIGTRLFDRKQKPISITPAGQVLVIHAQEIMDKLRKAETAMSELDTASPLHLNFAIIDDLDASLTPILASSIQSQNARSFIRTFSGRSDEVTAKLVSRDADIAVTATMPANIQKFQIQPLCREKYVIVMARGADPLMEDWRESLLKIPFVQYSESMPMGQQIATHLKRVHFNPNAQFSFETSRSVIATVARTGGWSITTPLCVLDGSRFRDDIDVHLLPFTNLSRDIHLISRVSELGQMPKLLARAFRDLLRNELIPEFATTAPYVTNMIEISD